MNNNNNNANAGNDVLVQSENPVLLLEKPKTVRELSAYYHKISSQSEKKYLADRTMAWINTGNFNMSESTWEDGIELLSMNDAGVSSAWLNFVFANWQKNLSQPDWMKSALNSTILRLVYQQPEVLSFGGAVSILDEMLDWLANAEAKLGTIPSGAEEAWRTIMIITSLLTISYREGVGKPIFKKLLKAIERLNLNIGGLKKKVKDLSEERKKLEGKKDKQQEIKTLQEQIDILSNQATHLEQLVVILRANRATLKIQGSRVQKIGLGLDIATNLFQSLTFAITGAGSIVVGTTALVAAIGSIPVTYGAGALLLIPAVAGFAGGVIAGGVSLVGAVCFGGSALMDAYFLGRSADEHPINRLFSGSKEEDLLLAIRREYLIEDRDGVKLNPKIKDRDSLQLIQFLGEILVHLGGASALKEELKSDVINNVRVLLKAIYQGHSRDQVNKDEFICREVISLMQVLQLDYGWFNLLTGVSQEQYEAKLSAAEWTHFYQKDGWFLLEKNEKVLPQNVVDRLTADIVASDKPLLLKYPKSFALQYDQNKTLFVPWSGWYTHDDAVERLGAVLYDASLNKKTDITQLKLQALEIESYISLAEKRFNQNAEQPLLSTYALALSKQLIAIVDNLEAVQKKVTPTFTEEQLKETLEDKTLTLLEKQEVVSNRANTVIQLLDLDIREKIFALLTSSVFKEENRFELLKTLLKLPDIKIKADRYIRGDHINQEEHIEVIDVSALPAFTDSMLRLRREKPTDIKKEDEIEEDILSNKDIEALVYINGNEILQGIYLSQGGKLLKQESSPPSTDNKATPSSSKSDAHLMSGLRDSPTHRNDKVVAAFNQGALCVKENEKFLRFNYLKLKSKDKNAISVFETELESMINFALEEKLYDIVKVNKTGSDRPRHQSIEFKTHEEAIDFAEKLDEALEQPKATLSL